MTAVSPNVANRLERLPMTRYQRMLFGIIATAWFFDSMDLGIMTFVLGSIKAEMGLSTAQAGMLASSSFLGMFLGAAIAGMLADKYGRKPVFQWSMIFLGRRQPGLWPVPKRRAVDGVSGAAGVWHGDGVSHRPGHGLGDCAR